MPDALTIDFAVTNFGRVEKSFKSVSKMSADAEKQSSALQKSLAAAAGVYDKLNAQIAKFNSKSSGGGGTPANGGYAAPSVFRSGGRAVSSKSYAAGPFQRQAALQEQLKSAMASGDTRAQADIRLAQVRNEAQIKKVTHPAQGFGGKIGELLQDTKFGSRGGVMSLAGRATGIAAEALGPEVMALAGPVGIVVAAVTAAATAVFDLAKGAAEAGAAFTSFQLSVGSMGKDSAQALTIGRAGGLSADATASQVNALQDGITGSSYGRATGLQYGAFNLAGPYGNQDYAGQYVKVMDAMRASKAPMEDKIRDARAMGIQGSLGSLVVSDKQYALGKQDAATKSKIFDPEFAQKSADFNDALSRVGDAFTNLEAALGKNVITSITNFLDGFATAINNLALFLNGPTGQFLLKVLTASPAAMAMDALGRAGGGDDANTTAVKANTAATNKLTDQIPGIYGKDTDGRLGRAFSEASGQGAMSATRNEYARGAVRLGAF